MKHFLRIAALLALVAFPSVANAACVAGTCFGIATGNWGTSGTWSATSGGITCACTPATGDALVFDAGSNGKTFSIDAAYSLLSITSSGASTATISWNAGFTVTITGSTFTLLNTMTMSGLSSSRIFAFNPASGTLTATTGGLTFAGAVTVNAPSATVLAGDNWTVGAGGITLTAGTLNANGFNITAPFFASTNTNTRTLTMGSGTWTMNGVSGTPWDTTTTTGLTLNANTSTLLFSSAATAARTFSTGAQTFATVTIANTSANNAAPFVLLGGSTIATLNLTNPVFVKFPTAATTTISNAFTWTGTSGNALTLGTTSTDGVAATISVASGTPTISWAGIYGVTFTGGATFTANNSVDLKGNTGITINVPAGGGGHIIGG